MKLDFSRGVLAGGLVVLAALFMACGGDETGYIPGLPTTTTTGGGGGGGGGTTYPALTVGANRLFGDGGISSASLAYAGPNRVWVKRLLERAVGPWNVATDGSGSLPNFTAAMLPCIRDSYVAAAVANAWAAEAYSRRGQTNLASERAADMMVQLGNADGLCSDSPVIEGGGECGTVRIFPCGSL